MYDPGVGSIFTISVNCKELSFITEPFFRGELTLASKPIRQSLGEFISTGLERGSNLCEN